MSWTPGSREVTWFQEEYETCVPMPAHFAPPILQPLTLTNQLHCSPSPSFSYLTYLNFLRVGIRPGVRTRGGLSSTRLIHKWSRGVFLPPPSPDGRREPVTEIPLRTLILDKWSLHFAQHLDLYVLCESQISIFGQGSAVVCFNDWSFTFNELSTSIWTRVSKEKNDNDVAGRGEGSGIYVTRFRVRKCG